MKHLLTLVKGGVFALAVVVALPLSAVNEEGYTFRDYHQTGLVAHWDTKNGLGSDTRARSGFWTDLISGRRLSLRGSSFDPELGVTREGGSAYWGVMNVGTTDFLMPREEGVTVEVCIDVKSTTYLPIFFGPRETGIGIWQDYYQPGGWVLSYDGLGENGRTVYEKSYGRAWDKLPVTYTLSICYTNGHVDESCSYEGGKLLKAKTAKQASATDYLPTEALRVMASSGGSGASGWGSFQLHAIRVYHGKLTAAQAEANRQLDLKRYDQGDYYADNRLFYSFKVKSGSVTVDGTTYNAGDFVYYRNNVAVPVVANNAVVVPRQDGTSQISLMSGTLKIAVEDESVMTYVKLLTLGAGATLNVPAKGLNAATLTAETGATATGTGKLVASAAACPVAGYANYLSANYTWTAWPASGIAYVPAGANLTVTAASAAALDGIAFLDDGTAAAKATTVTYSAADNLTLKAVMAGPGIFTATASGKLTITGDSRHFTGKFILDDLETLVTNPYGLGSDCSATTEVRIGASGGYCHFDNGTGVFINYAPLSVWSKLKTKVGTFGSESLEKQLVQAGTFEYTEADWGSEYVQLRLQIANNVTFLKGVFARAYASNRFHNPDLYILNPGRIEVRGTLSGSPSAPSFSYKTGASARQVILGAGAGVSLNGSYVLDAENAFGDMAGSLTDLRQPSIQVAKNWPHSVLDLNGYDQYIGAFDVANASASWTEDMIVTSAAPATVRMVNSANKTLRIPFRGAAALTYAPLTVQTNKLSAVVSDTTGPLTVCSGRLELCNGYRWLGTNVVVKGGALVLSDSASFGKKTILSVDDDAGASVTLPGAGSVAVLAFKRNGRWVPAGTYGGAAALAAGRIDSRHCLSCFGADSTGVLVVRRHNDSPVGLIVVYK